MSAWQLARLWRSSALWSPCLRPGDPSLSLSPCLSSVSLCSQSESERLRVRWVGAGVETTGVTDAQWTLTSETRVIPSLKCVTVTLSSDTKIRCASGLLYPVKELKCWKVEAIYRRTEQQLVGGRTTGHSPASRELQPTCFLWISWADTIWHHLTPSGEPTLETWDRDPGSAGAGGRHIA